MTKRLVWAMALLLCCASLTQAFALGELVLVTQKTQAELKLKFTLEAEKVDDEAVLVRMEIPRKGKLQNLRSVHMTIAKARPINGRPLLTAPLQTTEKNGSWIVHFQIAPDLADKCYVELIETTNPTYTVYAIELKGYIKNRK